MKAVGRSKTLSIFGSYGRASVGDKAILVGLLDLLLTESATTSISVKVLSFDFISVLEELKLYEWSKYVEVVPLFSKQGSLSTIFRMNSQLERNSLVMSLFDLFPRAISAWPDIFRFKVLMSNNLAEGSDGLIIGGGNLLMDLYSKWPIKPYLVARQFCDAGLPVMLAGVGAFPIRTWWGRILLKRLVRDADIVFVRDSRTQDYIQRCWHLSAECHPDFALSFPLPNTDDMLPREDSVVAVNFAPVYGKNWPYRNREKYEKFIGAFSVCLKEYFSFKGENICFYLYNTNHGDQDGTIEFTERLIALGIPQQRIRREDRLLTSTEVVQELCGTQLAVVTRLHAGLLALRVGLPVVAISYQPKVKNVMLDLGLKAGLIEIEDADNLLTCLKHVDLEPDIFKLSQEKLSELDQTNRKVVRRMLEII